jgi:hypothetical protein
MADRWSYTRLSRVGLDHADAEGVSAFVLPDGHLHGELDAVCPRCLRWIEEREIVRRTAYGPLQHEVCPEPLAASS